MTEFHVYRLVGQLTGFSSILLGVLLMVLGVRGDAEFIFEGATISAKLVNATPGALLAVIGLIILLWYRHTESTRVTTEIMRSALKDMPAGPPSYQTSHLRTEEKKDRAMLG